MAFGDGDVPHNNIKRVTRCIWILQSDSNLHVWVHYSYLVLIFCDASSRFKRPSNRPRVHVRCCWKLVQRRAHHLDRKRVWTLIVVSVCEIANRVRHLFASRRQSCSCWRIAVCDNPLQPSRGLNINGHDGKPTLRPNLKDCVVERDLRDGDGVLYSHELVHSVVFIYRPFQRAVQDHHCGRRDQHFHHGDLRDLRVVMGGVRWIDRRPSTRVACRVRGGRPRGEGIDVQHLIGTGG